MSDEIKTGDDEQDRSDDSNGVSAGDKRKRPTSRKKPSLGSPDADPQRIHREYVERHLGGGGEQTPEAYERAVRQWRRIPGALSHPPGELRAPETDSPDGESGGNEDRGAS